MAYFLNNVASINQFAKTTKDKYFVDKSELIEKMNELVGTSSQYVCITRPRRFGKTINAMMLASYYSKNANFKELFDKLEISKSETYLEHLNKHNLVYITFNSNSSDLKTYADYIEFYKGRLIQDIIEFYPDVNKENTISEMFKEILDKTGEEFILKFSLSKGDLKSKNRQDINEKFINCISNMITFINNRGKDIVDTIEK